MLYNKLLVLWEIKKKTLFQLFLLLKVIDQNNIFFKHTGLGRFGRNKKNYPKIQFAQSYFFQTLPW